MKLYKLIPALFLSAACAQASLVTDTFSTYGSHLDSADSLAATGYDWTVVHSVPTYSHELNIDSGGKLRVGGYPHESHSGVAGQATAIYQSAFKPTVDGYEISFDFHEYHELLKLEVTVDGKDTHTIELVDFIFTYPATGRATLLFGTDRIIEKITGHSDRTILYNSIGSGTITGTDRISSFSFIGLHQNSGHNIVQVSNLTTTAIPEPAVLLLVGIFGGGIIAIRRFFLI